MKTPALLALRIFLAAFFALWAIAAGSVGVNRWVLHRPYPLNTFLFRPDAKFSDFTVFAPRFEVWDKGTFFSIDGFPFTYPAPVLLCQLADYKLSSYPLLAYLLAVLLFASALAIFLAAGVRRETAEGRWTVAAILLTATLSFPLLYLLDRANLEGFVWFASAAGLVLFLRRWFVLAAICIGLATSMKIFPGLLMLLFLSNKRYRALAVSVLACAFFTVGSLWLVGPSVSSAAAQIAFGIDYFRNIQIFEYRPVEVGFDHSLFALVKQAAHVSIRDVPSLNALLPRIYLPYAVFAVILFAVIYGTRLRRMPALNQFLALPALSITLPFVSYDYTLVHMYVPCAALLLFLARDVAAGTTPVTTRQLLWFLLPLAIVFTPQSYLIHGYAGFGGQVKTAALFCLVGACMWIELPSTIFGDALIES